MSSSQTRAVIAERDHESVADGRSRHSSAKLLPHHFERSAIVYVRQSSPQQVVDHQESRARQYALVDLAVEFGWPPDRIEVIDDDQGFSGATAEGRLGFQRLLAEVSLDHVGMILGIELSRLARSNKDWHQLLELCAIFRTALADQDGIYDPTQYNDRLLLGLRGMMSEAELHMLRGRMYEAVLHKARRGELYILPPVGYVKSPAGGFDLDPDEQVQSVVRLVFDQFDRQGTVRGVVRYLVERGIKIPIRPHSGPNRGRIEWRSPTRDTVGKIVSDPLYAGFYRYGHRQVDARRKQPGKPGSGRVVVNPDDYHAFIADHCPAYITRERYEQNQRRIADNQSHAQAKGVPREGSALLGGLVVCSHCERRMSVHYSGRARTLRYTCSSGVSHGRGSGCQSLSGNVLDELVTDKIMVALEPARLELSLLAADDLQRERERLAANWQQRLERAQYEADRAERQYRAVEPENRLVARELERRWEDSLRELQSIRQDYARFRQTQGPTLGEDERQLIYSLSESLPKVWNAATTTWTDRQRIVRMLLERVVVHVHGATDQVDVALHWAGGFTSQHELTRPVLRYDQMAEYPRMISRIHELYAAGKSFAAIARDLNHEQFRPVKQAEWFDSDMVGRIWRARSTDRPGSKLAAARAALGSHEWLVVDLAAELDMPKNTLSAWIKRGWVHVVRQFPGYRGRMICWADPGELDRLRQLRKTKHGWWDPPLPPELTTPKPASNNPT